MYCHYPTLKEQMESGTYLDVLRDRYSLYFDINPSQLLKSVSNLDLCASFYLKETVNSILLRSIEFYSIEDYEHCFVRLIDKKVSVEDLDDFTSEVRLAGDKIIKPNEHHKKTVLTCVVISEKGIEDDAIDYVRKFKFQQPYRFYFYGWSEMHIVVVDLEGSAVFHNIKSGKTKKQIESLYRIQ